MPTFRRLGRHSLDVTATLGSVERGNGEISDQFSGVGNLDGLGFRGHHTELPGGSGGAGDTILGLRVGAVCPRGASLLTRSAYVYLCRKQREIP